MAMGIWLPGGGGADLDAITAESGDVLEGKVILDSEGEPLLGTMPERGDWSSSELAAGASITVPEGHHGGGGKVTAKSLSAQTSGTATAAQILSGKTAWVNGKEYTGTMPNRGDYNGWGNSKGNDAGNQRMWVKVPSGYYNENANVFLSWADIRNMAGITAAKIKKGESIMGIIGSFEGYVAGPTDLYNRGQNPYNFTGNNITNESGGLRFIGITKPVGSLSFYITSSRAFNFVPYSKLRIWFLVDQVKYYSDSNYIFEFGISNGSSVIAQGSLNGNLNTMYMMELNIASYAATSILNVYFKTKQYDDASGSDSDPSWNNTQFNGWIYQIAVA